MFAHRFGKAAGDLRGQDDAEFHRSCVEVLVESSDIHCEQREEGQCRNGGQFVQLAPLSLSRHKCGIGKVMPLLFGLMLMFAHRFGKAAVISVDKMTQNFTDLVWKFLSEVRTFIVNKGKKDSAGMEANLSNLHR